jgi:fibronectin-binding autotransporter adhesin
MSLNFQDVIRDVHDPVTHSLQTSGGGATVFAVVNTAAAGDTVNNIGFATVSVSNPTLYAVVNTSAAGVGNSIVTINPRTDYIGLMSISGNVNVGLPTVTVGNQTIYAVVNTTATATSNVTLDPGSQTKITDGTETLGINADGSLNAYLVSSVANVGFATVAVSTPTLYAVVNTAAAGVANSMVTINPRVDYIGLMSVSGNVAVSSLPAIPTGANYIGLASIQGNVVVSTLPTLPAGVNGIGFATVNLVNQPALTASSAFVGLVTVANTVPVSFSGNVTLTDPKTYIGSVSVSGTVGLGTGTLNIGSVSILGGTINTTLATSNLNIGSVSVLGGVINTNINAGVTNIGFATVSVSNATLYAVVNTGAAGVVNSIVTIAPRTDYFGLVSVSGNVAVSALPALVASTVNIGSVSVLGGSIGLNAGITGIGFATVSLGAGNSNVGDVDVASIAAGANYIGLVTAVNGLAWPDPKTYIGLVTVGHTVTVAAHALTASTVNIGSVSVLGGTINATLDASPSFIGIVTIANQPALVASNVYIGLVTANIGTTKAWANPNTFIGLTTSVNASSTANIGSVSILGGTIINGTGTLNIGSVSILGGGIGINAGVNNIGFATVTLSGAGNPSVFAVNVGTNKTLLNLPIGFSTASVVTVAVPATNTTVKITNMLLNSDATVRFTIKSGVTYLTGNASIGITLNPGGGFIMTGSPDSPSWIGLPSGALVIEKLDLTATSAKIAGNVVYFVE